ncbi:MAG: gluconate 2-dehydrogenase subunit 3 family protein [Bryobacteraceae bacterium]
MKTRREVLHAIVLTPAGVALAQHRHAQSVAAPPPKTYHPRYFPPAQYELLSSLVECIVPRTDTPGAVDAGVPEFIDRQVGGDKKLQARFRAGFSRLDAASRKRHGKPFANLDRERQIAVLQPLSARKDKFFQMVKEMTIDGYYTSREGLSRELGWDANTFLPEFKGCTHPEHQT